MMPPRSRRAVFADPKMDLPFKKVFGTREHKDLLIDLLNALLRLPPEARIVGLEHLSGEQLPPRDGLKLSILDVKCTDARGARYVVEMQVFPVEGFEKRVVYNASKAYVSQAGDGDQYPTVWLLTAGGRHPDRGVVSAYRGHRAPARAAWKP